MSWLCGNALQGVDQNDRYTYRSAQPKSITASGADAATPQDRINPDGSVTQRNLGRKDNQFSSLDFRLSKSFPYGRDRPAPAPHAFNFINHQHPPPPPAPHIYSTFTLHLP